MTITRFKAHIETALSFLTESRLLIAISGGIDSVVLTHLCHKLELNFALAHCNFSLRGAESDADEAFVKQLAEDLEVDVFTQRFDTEGYAKTEKRSIQMAARELRYAWFTELANQLDVDCILTAHHADDNLETFLINFTRGTGLEGLTGIPEVNGAFVRPLLPFSSAEITAYAKANGISWRDDSSNASVKYLRNKLRHELVPILKEINPSVLQSFQSTLSHLKATADIVEESTNAVLKRAISHIDATHIAFKVAEFKKVNNPKAYLYEVFKSYGFTAWEDMLALLDAETGKQLFSNTHRLIKNRAELLLTEITASVGTTRIAIPETAHSITTPLGTLFITTVTDSLEIGEPHTIYVDKATLKGPLYLRQKEEGDVFYPVGMRGKKKLSKYFKDEKYSLLAKENAWLLCSGNEIVWVLGKRADARFKVTKATKFIIALTLRP